MQTIENIYKMNQIYKKLSNEKIYKIINDVLYIQSNSERKDLTPLEIELLMNNEKEVLNLINKGTDLNQISSYGYYPLEIAIATNNYELTKILIEKGANVNIKSEYIPLNIAVTIVNCQIVKLLIDNNVDINQKDQYGFNALHYLLDTGKIIDLKKPIDLINRFGKNIHKNQTENNYITIIDMLVKNGINVNCRGKMYNLDNNIIEINPLSLALESFTAKVVKKILDSGSEKTAFEIQPSDIYAYQDSFSFPQDILDMDISLWPDAPREFINYLKYLKKIKKFDIEVYSSNFGDGYKRSKKIKKLEKRL